MYTKKIKKNITIFLIYYFHFLLILCKLLTFIQYHYSEKLIKLNNVKLDLIYNIIFSCLLIFIIGSMFFPTIFFVLLICVKDYWDIVKKMLVCCIIMICSYIIWHFTIIKYIIIIGYILYNNIKKLKKSYYSFEYHFKRHKLEGILFMLHEITNEIVLFLINYINKTFIITTKVLIKLPLN